MYRIQPRFGTALKQAFLIPLQRNILHVSHKDRGLIRIRGKDGLKFLHKVSTSDFDQWFSSPTKVNLFSLFLTPTGRYLYDCFTWNVNPELLYLDVEKETMNQLISHLKVFILTSKVKMEVVPESDYAVSQWIPQKDIDGEKLEGDAVSFGGLNGNKDQSMIAVDPRTYKLGWRSLQLNSSNDDQSIGAALSEYWNESVQQGTEKDYNRWRALNGLPEGRKELLNSIPLEASLQYYHCISYRKGCYIGQELIARVHFKGEVRKSVMGVVLSPAAHSGWSDVEQSLPKGDDTDLDIGESSNSIVNQDGAAVGKLIAHYGSAGLAMIRLSHAEKLEAGETCFRVQTKEGDTPIHVVPVKPHWWSDRVRPQ